MAGSDDSHLHAVRTARHPGHIRPGHDGAEEAAVGGDVQPQLAGGGRSSTGDGKRPEGPARGEAHLRPCGLGGDAAGADEPRAETSTGADELLLSLFFLEELSPASVHSPYDNVNDKELTRRTFFFVPTARFNLELQTNKK